MNSPLRFFAAALFVIGCSHAIAQEESQSIEIEAAAIQSDEGGPAAIIMSSVAFSLPSWGITNESLDVSVAQNRCCSCSGAFPREAARLCGSCSNKYSSKCCLCSGAFPTDIARLCGSCSNKYRSKCFICSGAFPKEVGRLCSRCTSKY